MVPPREDSPMPWLGAQGLWGEGASRQAGCNGGHYRRQAVLVFCPHLIVPSMGQDGHDEMVPTLYLPVRPHPLAGDHLAGLTGW
jgi:hypothetical protein